MEPKNKLFVALDNMGMSEVNKVLDPIAKDIGGIKLGMEFWNRYNVNGVKRVTKSYNLPLFLDLKLHDIPNTVALGLRYALEAKPYMTTIHASGGTKMIEAAKNEIAKSRSPNTKLLAVTVLTSLEQNDLSIMGYTSTLPDVVLKLAENAIKSGADGIVCSPQELEMVRKNLGDDILIVTPGIRMTALPDDQKRTLTPKEAVEKGASFIVVGRPITEANDKISAVKQYMP